MDNEASFADLIAKLRQGDPAAAERIFRTFARRLVGLARTRLTQDVRGKTDPEDVVQSVFRSFFTRQAQGQFEVAGWHDLWSLLAVITLRKSGHKVEHFRAACRDVTREVAPPAAADSDASWEALGREPTPVEAAMLLETVENLMRTLDERDRRVLEMSLQGQRVQEMSEHLSCTERTIERSLERIRQHLEKTNLPCAN